MPRPGCWLAILAICFMGCGSVDLYDVNADPVTITGHIKYRGISLQGGWIVFSADPDFDAGTDVLMAEVASDGQFHASNSTQKGLKPGYYRIAVSSHRNNRMTLPIRYQDPSISGLKCMVETNQPLRIKIELD